MPQSPFRADGIQIQPGAGLPNLTITRDPDTGGLLFTDDTLASPVLLAQLVSSAISTVFVVSTTGPGTYATIQDALDAVPDIATGEYTILVYGGVYTGNINWTKDRVTLFALGNVIHTVDSGDNIEISGPVTAKIVGVTFQNTDTGAVLNIVGSEPELVSSVHLENCFFDIAPTAIAVNATFVDTFRMVNSRAPEGSFILSQVQQSVVWGSQLPATGLSYDTALNDTNPDLGDYVFQNCVFQSLLVNTQGSGSVTLTGCHTGNLGTNGDILTTLQGGTTATLSANGPVVAVQHPVASVSGPAIADVPVQASIAFTAQASRTYTFPAPRTDTNYTVFVEPNGQSPSIAKTDTGFTLTYADAFTGSVRFRVE